MQTSPLDTFRTRRLIAERLQSGHLADYLRLLHDPRVMATLSADGKPLTAEEAARWLRLSLEHWDRHGYGFWAFRTIGDGQFVGRAGLKKTHLNGKDEVELAYALVPEFWSQGMATEIARATLKLAFEKIALSDVICYTLTRNLASQRVMQKVGFCFEREGIHAELPHVFYRVKATEFAASGATESL
jgi:ribosomal-protein-alanine N-acetyltransferase